MFRLRKYQSDGVRAGVDFLRGNEEGGGLVVAPTGSGKSLYIAAIADELNEPTLVFQPSKEILQQNFAKMVAFGHNPEVYSASAGRKKIAPITFATIGSVYKKPELFKGFKNIIIDECHLASINQNDKGDDPMYKKFFAALGNPRVLGLTATPYRLYGSRFGSELRFLTRIKGGLFKHLVHYTQVKDLEDEGFLSPIEYFRHKGIDLSKLQFNSAGTDYTEASVRLAMQAGGFEGKVVNMCLRLTKAGRRGILVFTKFVAEAELIAKTIPGAQFVSGETPPAERDQILKDFKSGKTKVLVNVGVLIVGFDYPELDTVILAGPTASLSRYYQMVGRVIRPHSSKQMAWVLDMCGLVDRFGPVNELLLEIKNGLPEYTGVSKQTGKRKTLTNVVLDKYGEPYRFKPKTPARYELPRTSRSWY